MILYIARLERGGRLWYANSWAFGATAFTVRRAACTVERMAGGIFFRCSETVTSRVGIARTSSAFPRDEGQRATRAGERRFARGRLIGRAPRRPALDAFTFASQSMPCARDHSRQSGTGSFTVHRK